MTDLVGASIDGGTCRTNGTDNQTGLNESTAVGFMNRTYRYRYPIYYPVEYQVLATVLHVVIFVLGVFGNVAVVIVVRRTKSLHTPTYCYLVSLAVADLIVLVSAMPEAIVSHHLIKRQWVLGQAGCSILVFSSFLGINASSTSILCFTVERYIGICKPMLAQKLCSVERAKKIIVITWITSVLYCCPWLALTITRVERYRNHPPTEHCEYRLSREKYVYFFMLDFVIFYVMPLVVAIALYVQIGITLKQRTPGVPAVDQLNFTMSPRHARAGTQLQLLRKHSYHHPTVFHDRSAVQVVRMLLVIVILFAVLWLPYRAVLVYNSLVAYPWLNIWYMLFAKTCIYLNSAINPLMYNAMSKKFRAAFMPNIFNCNNNYGTGSDSLVSRSMSLASTLVPPSIYLPTPRGSIIHSRCGSRSSSHHEIHSTRNLSIAFYPSSSAAQRYSNGPSNQRSCSVYAPTPGKTSPTLSVTFSVSR